MAESQKNEGGRGEGFVAIKEGLDDPHHRRGTLRMLATAIKNNHIRLIDLPDEAVADLAKITRESINRAANAGDERSVIGGVKVLVNMIEVNRETAKVIDHDARLSAGEATEITQIRVVDDTD
jgi:hypothetical protein